MPTKVLILKSSPREKGNSNTLADQVAAGAIRTGAQVESIFLNRLTIAPCKACDSCREGHEGCVIDDDMQMVYPKLLWADAIVFASPIYWFTFSAQLKLCIDRLYAMNTSQGHALRGKKMGLVFTYGDDDLYTSGGINAITTFEAIARWVQFEVVGMVYGTANAMGDAQNQPALMEKANALGRRLVTGGK